MTECGGRGPWLTSWWSVPRLDQCGCLFSSTFFLVGVDSGCRSDSERRRCNEPEASGPTDTVCPCRSSWPPESIIFLPSSKQYSGLYFHPVTDQGDFFLSQQFTSFSPLVCKRKDKSMAVPVLRCISNKLISSVTASAPDYRVALPTDMDRHERLTQTDFLFAPHRL